ncbi:LytR/AlgR family response regulator transcription factor [Mucilaginibacter humi]|uniref:LytR/AlgR family response regulator transcription factor n=1 Tax=Mucilaginibacter humi TaxID=2732510 RepID=UPI001C2E2D58|nr:LytTR family DNA-binding domain-containing protein [Mucilaginibacter humi]
MNKIDLLFIDINMPDISGVDLVRALGDNKPMVIFTTAYKNFAYEGFELQALDYLLKPIDQKRFAAAIERAIEYHEYKSGDSNAEDEAIYVHSEYRTIKINLKEIEYPESMQDYVKIYLSGNSKPILTLQTLKSLLEKLPEKQFVRIHRSYAISLKQVKSIHNRKVQLHSIELPVGTSYIDTIKGWSA